MVFKREKVRTRLIWVGLALLMVLCTVNFAYAKVAVPELDKDVKANLIFKSTTEPEKGKPMVGATVRLYRVADLKVRSDIPYYELCGDFSKLDNPILDKMTAEESLAFAKECAKVAVPSKADYVVKTDANGETGKLPIDKNQGMYLIMVENVPKDFDPVEPYLLMLPAFIGDVQTGHWEYDVDALPKVSLVAHPAPPETPTPPPAKNPPDKTRTGDLQNPEFYLSLLGIAILGVVCLRYVKKSKTN